MKSSTFAACSRPPKRNSSSISTVPHLRGLANTGAKGPCVVWCASASSKGEQFAIGRQQSSKERTRSGREEINPRARVIGQTRGPVDWRRLPPRRRCAARPAPEHDPCSHLIVVLDDVCRIKLKARADIVRLRAKKERVMQSTYSGIGLFLIMHSPRT